MEASCDFCWRVKDGVIIILFGTGHSEIIILFERINVEIPFSRRGISSEVAPLDGFYEWI